MVSLQSVAADELFIAVLTALCRYDAQTIAERRIAALTQDLKTFALEKLQQTLEAIAWPAELETEDLEAKVRSFVRSSIAGMDSHSSSRGTLSIAWCGIACEQSTQLEAVGQAFAYLLALQLSQESAGAASEPRAPSRELWAIETLLQALVVRFQYHFERAASPTNRLAKPEWVLSHVLTQVHAHAPFLHAVLTPELEKQRAALPCCDAQILLLRGFIRVVQRKLRNDLPSLIAVRLAVRSLDLLDDETNTHCLDTAAQGAVLPHARRSPAL